MCLLVGCMLLLLLVLKKAEIDEYTLKREGMVLL